MSDYIKHIANYFISGEVPELHPPTDQADHSFSCKQKKPLLVPKNAIPTE
jgi:hypothetical protein